MRTKELNHWNDSPSNLFPQLPPISWKPGICADTSGLLSCRHPEIYCYPLQHEIFIYSTAFAVSAVSSSTRPATSRLPALRKAARSRGQEMSHGNSSLDSPHLPHALWLLLPLVSLCRLAIHPRNLGLVGPKYPGLCLAIA